MIHLEADRSVVLTPTIPGHGAPCQCWLTARYHRTHIREKPRRYESDSSIAQRTGCYSRTLGSYRFSDQRAMGQSPADSAAPTGFALQLSADMAGGRCFPIQMSISCFCMKRLKRNRAEADIPRMCQALWDRHLRLSPTTRSLAECGKLHRDNLEFNISLLDCRYLCGDADLFEQLHSRVIPKMVAREALELQQRLTDLTSARHSKYGHTIFHLEPNIKEHPGGLRDYQVACWLSLISELEKSGVWPSPENLLPGTFREECRAAMDFLSAVRCFLHYRQGRDLNGLTYELQAEAAAAGIGIPGGFRLCLRSGCGLTSGMCVRSTGSPCCSTKCLQRGRAFTVSLKIASLACRMPIFQ